MLAVRIVTAAISLALVALAWYNNPVLGGGENFGWFQAVLFTVGIVVGAFCFAPLAWNARALILLVSVFFTLGAAEFVLRFALGPQFYGIYQLDDHVLYRLIPGAQRMNTLPPVNGSLRIQYEINSLGFRGKELAPLGESLRVVVYGDSFIQGDFSQTEDTFTVRLKAHLESQMGKSVEVVNAGVAGYGPDQEFRRMEDELSILKPNLVIVAIYAGNDFGDLVRNKLYRLSSDGSLHQNPPVVLQDSFARDSARARSEPILRKMLRNALNRLRGNPDQDFPTGHEARREQVEANLTQAVSEYRQYVVEGDNVVHELYRDPYNADVSLTPWSESARYKISMMEQIIVRMHLTAASQHVPLLFVLIPSPIDVAEVHETGEIDTMRYPAYRRSGLTDILDQICRRNQLLAVNLFGPFWERGARELYLKGGDDHWNVRGQDFAAELVSNYVTGQGLLRTETPVAHTDNKGIP
ncbi:MAG: SGNH/GDSL hydrolase family protein [Pseudomonadota bacterium]